ncbi:hypothetical protein WCLP8_4870004 [uncultured Gammaproteobacteria bacterium]
MSPDTKTPVTVLWEIGAALGLKTLGGGGAKMRRAICERILNTSGLLILDEAQHLGLEALETARRIHDSAEIGLAFAGDDKLWDRFGSSPQLSSRIGKRVSISGTDPKDVLALAEALGIEGKEERHFLGDIARIHGGLRSVAKTQRLASVIASGQGKPLAIEHLRGAWKNLNLGPSA